jgi:hypothetical protein
MRPMQHQNFGYKDPSPYSPANRQQPALFLQ